jgi:hypothetical protein
MLLPNGGRMQAREKEREGNLGALCCCLSLAVGVLPIIIASGRQTKGSWQHFVLLLSHSC